MLGRSVAIIGISGVYPDAENLGQFYLNLVNGVDSVREVSAQRKVLAGLDPSASSPPIASLENIDKFDHEFFGISRKEAEYMDPQQRLLLQLACAAIEDAGYSLKQFRGSNTATVVSASNNDYSKLYDEFDPSMVTGQLPGALAGRISYCLDLHGPAMVIDTACSSSLLAIHEAYAKVASGQVDYAIAGGINLFFVKDWEDYDGDGSEQVAGPGINSPDGKCKTFDAAANGAGWGEGGGLIVMKPFERALADRDHIYAVIKGGGVNQDGGRSNGLAAPSPHAQRDVIVAAWKNAGIEPTTISYLEAHGTGTELGDPIEIQGITDAFRQFTDRKQFCAIGALKTNIGHLAGAAGIAGFTKLILSLKYQKIFPSLHYHSPNPFIDFQNSPVFVNTQLRDWTVPEEVGVKRAGISSFGLSGTNVHLILEEAPQSLAVQSSAQGRPTLITVSARTPSALRRYLESLAQFLKNSDDGTDIADIAYTLNIGRDDYRYRFAQVVRSRQELIERLDQHLAQPEDAEPSKAVKGDRSLVFLLPGDAQVNDQLIGSLSAQYPAFKSGWDQCKVNGTATLQQNVKTVTFLYSLYHAWTSLGVSSNKIIGTGIGNIAVGILTGRIGLREGLSQALSYNDTRVSPDPAKLKTVLDEIKRTTDPLFLEFGQNTELAKEIGNIEKELPVVRSWNGHDDLLPVVAQLYKRGANIDWEKFCEGREYNRVPLPTYPFEPTSCWVPQIATVQPVRTQNATESIITSEIYGELDGEATETERKLASLWGEVLKVKSLNVDDDFFDLGGNSLDGTQILSRIKEAFDVKIEFELLYDYPTLKTLGEYIDGVRKVEPAPQQSEPEPQAPEDLPTQSNSVVVVSSASGQERLWFQDQLEPGKTIREGEGRASMPIETIARGGPLPLSFSQQRLSFIDQFAPGNVGYNVSTTVRLRGPLDCDALERSLDLVVRRHEVLRSVFPVIDGRAVQLVEPVQFRLPVIDLRDWPDPSTRDARVVELATEESRVVFDLARGPLFRATLLRLDHEEHVLLLTMHHIVSDEWSLGVLIRETATAYEAYADGKEPLLADLSIQYADYAAWQREWLQGEVLQKQVSYWREQLAGAPAILELPTDHPRPASRSFQGKTLSFSLPPELTESLKELGRSERVTLFMLLTAAFQTLLHRYSQQQQISIGTPVAGRTHIETESLIGFFVNTLVLKTDFAGDPSFRELLQRVKKVALGAYAHQEVPFEKLVEELKVERSLSHTPLFQVMFAMQSMAKTKTTLRLPRLELELLETERETTQFDLVLFMTDVGERLVGQIEYGTDLFDATTIERMAQHFETLLQSIVAEPQQRVSQLPLLGEAEREQLQEWNQTAREYPSEQCVHQFISAHAARQPNVVAVRCGDEQLTYGELNERANQLAHYLREFGVGAESLVGVCLERSLDMMVTLVGIFKAGGAYLPLDPEYPSERLRYMVEDAGVKVALTQQHLSTRLRNELPDVEWIAIDEKWTTIATQPRENPQIHAQPENLAYVIYTSGSTGMPKGVMITNQSLTNYALTMMNCIGLEPGERMLEFASLSFDASVVQIFPALLGGATVVIDRAVSKLSNHELLSLCEQQEITVLDLPAAYWRQWVDDLSQQQVRLGASLRVFMTGGETLPGATLLQWSQLVDHTALFINSYGPTEATVGATVYRTDSDQTASFDVPAISIGKPLANVKVYLLDSQMQQVPVGVSGELYVGGIGLGRGYLNRPGLTAEKFIPNPFAETPGERLYKTGDLARYLPDGQIDFQGRKDHQVKIRGFRVELGEIEASIRDHDGIKEAVVIIKEDKRGDKRLVAYYVSSNEAVLTTHELKNHLKESLPEYMVPSIFVRLEAMPLTSSAKVDRQALALSEYDYEAGESFIGPRTPTEEIVAGQWADVLDVPQVGIYDDFFDLGGHSLLATQLISRLREVFQVDLPLRHLFEAPTVAGIAALIDEASTTQMAPITPAPRDTELPLSFAQQRFWFLDQLEGGTGAFNIPAAVVLKGKLNRMALARSFDEIVKRHEALRTAFVNTENGLVQVIQPAQGVVTSHVDLTALPEDTRRIESERLVATESNQTFDLSAGSLLSIVLLQLEEQEHLLILTTHHIAFDGWSLGVFINELATFYNAFVAGENLERPALPIQYADYAYWQRQTLQGDVLEDHLNYWKRQLENAPATLNLPTDRPRAAVQTFRGDRMPFAFTNSLTEALKALSRREGATLFMTAFAAFATLLNRYSGQEDLVIGADIANRTRMETESLIGCFFNHVALRADLSGRPTFRELLRRVRQVTLGAYAHQDLPFDMVVQALQPERSANSTPLFQVLLVFLNVPMNSVELPDLTLVPQIVEPGIAKFDLTLFISAGPNGLEGSLEFNTDLFEHATANGILTQFQTLLEAIVDRPDVELDQLSIRTEEEGEEVLVGAFNDVLD